MVYLKKNYKLFICILCLLILLAYVTNITSIPNSLILFENEKITIEPIFGLKLEEAVTVGANITHFTNTSETEKNVNTEKQVTPWNKTKEYTLSLLGIPLKTIQTTMISRAKVVPLGNLVGLKLYTKGVLVVGVSEIKGEDNQIYKPYEEAGIQQGDTILKINDEEVETTDELIACVSKGKGNEVKVTGMQNGKIYTTTMKPVKTSKNTYKIGLWVRDTAAGVGTLTFYDPSTNSCAALGHGIQDIDTEELVEISSGEFVSADILELEKGKENVPGKIQGAIQDNQAFGKIYSNTEFGVYGLTSDIEKLKIENRKEVEVASRNEITTGNASILCTLENNITKEYAVQIEKVWTNHNEDNKSMVVKVTDPELLEKTGGIIQGMSGSPILQNGKLIGALTHVFVSNPQKRIWCIRR